MTYGSVSLAGTVGPFIFVVHNSVIEIMATARLSLQEVLTTVTSYLGTCKCRRILQLSERCQVIDQKLGKYHRKILLRTAVYC